MSGSWTLSVLASRTEVEAALLRLETIDDWDAELVVAGHELAPERPEDWTLVAWYPRRPGHAQRRAIQGLFDGAPPELAMERVPDRDWVALSQQGTRPIRAGPFHVRTPDFAPDDTAIDFVIPAAQAFGTGQHATTAGCLEMLAAMKACGLHPRRIADIGTGTGLLGMAALSLWPLARVTASDIDPVCTGVVSENLALNDIAVGSGRGALAMVIAPGLEHRELRANAPFDLLIANILADPLIDLAPSFANGVAPGGSVILAGLLAGEQERAVRRAYRRAGFAPRGRIERGDWAILWLRRLRH